LHSNRSSKHLLDYVAYFGQSDKTHERTEETGHILKVVENTNSKFKGKRAWNNQWNHKTDNTRNPDNDVHDRDRC
jgi:hypothetical protein